MHIRAKPSRRRLDRITLELASMIDVTFLLLIYFMVSTVLAQQEDRLSPTLQTRTDAAAQSISDLQPQVLEVVRVNEQAVYRLGTRVITTREELAEVLRSLPKSEGIFVNVANQVPVGAAVAAIQVAKDVGFDQVTYVPAE